MIYEVRFLNHGGFEFSMATLDAESDSDAIALAHRRFRDGGPGLAFTVWCAGRYVHSEKITPIVDSTAEEAFAKIADCLMQAVASGDLQYRRMLMVLAEMLAGSAKPDGLPHYRLVLSGAGQSPIAELDFTAEDSREAFVIAAALADCCAHLSARFELWEGQALVASATGPFHTAKGLSPRARRMIALRGVGLHDGCKTIADSDGLLAKLAPFLTTSA